jgi:hypothetical protein
LPLARAVVLAARVSQRSVEIFVGRLVTDEDWRGRYRADPAAALAAFREEGHALSPVEDGALRTLDAGALARCAGTVDPRLQKASLALPLRRPRTRR